MIWLEKGADRTVPVEAELALRRAAAAADPANAALRARLGAALLRAGRHQDACEAFEAALRLNPVGFGAWNSLAASWLGLDRPDDALEACDRAPPDLLSADLCFQRGRALQALGRNEEGRVAFERALLLGDPDYDALRALLAPLARNPDGRALLAFCDSLEPRYRNAGLVLAHRAIALSRLGRTEEARALIDLERHVQRVPFHPPSGFGDATAFNLTLSEEILGAPEHADPEAAFDICYEPRGEGRPALSALLAFLREAMSDYVGTLGERGLSSVMPPPSAATLYASTLVLRGGGSNGEHVHRFGFVSAVYHARVPDAVAHAADRRGALVLGACDSYTDGYQPCWGRRYVRPEAGWLTIFPSHVFHDVVPSRTNDPRISVSADLRPVETKPGDRPNSF